MAMFNRILCPVDLSDHSRHALDEAVALARHYGAAVTVLYVIPLPVPPISTLESPAYMTYVYTPEDLEAIERGVRSFVEGEGAGTPIETQVVQGYAVGEILAMADSIGADLIVVGTHGRGGVQRLFLGSVAERVLARASCPVMTVPPHMPEAAPFGPSLFANVLCAIDHSPSSLRALRLATALASESNARLTLVNVVEKATSEPALAGGFTGADHESLLVSAARTHLHKLLPSEPDARAAARDLVLTGKPYRAILHLAQEQRTDVIVVGAHGGLVSLLGVGSTTHHIVREATCPVISVRA